MTANKISDLWRARAARFRRSTLAAPIFAASICLLPGRAFAAGAAVPEHALASFIVELGLLLLIGRLMGEAAEHIGQPPVMGQLIGGLLLGPSVLGAFWPAAQHALFPGEGPQKDMLEGVSQLGILMLLLLTGMETDLQLVRRVGRTAAAVAFAGVAIPFMCGFALGEFLPDSLLPKPGARLVTSVFIGIALSISSVKIVAMVVREMNFMRRDIGQIVVASAILEDTIGWIILAIAFGFASAGAFDAVTTIRAITGTVLFLALSLTVGRHIVSVLIRWANDHFSSEFPVITVILVVMLAMALITDWIGVNVVLGAFVAGILIGESPILTRHIDEQLRGLIVALFMPVFFGLSGLSANLTVLREPALALLAAGLIVFASLGKFAGAFLGAMLGRRNFPEAIALGCAMNGRGSTEIIVASIGLYDGLLSENLFTLIVVMAVVTTLWTPPLLRSALSRIPLQEDERMRLEREEIDSRGFVTNLERLLVAVDDSPNGRFAARLAGIVGGSRSKPTTILEMPSKSLAGERSDDDAATSEAAEEARSAAEQTTSLETHPDVEKQARLDLTTLRRAIAAPDHITQEARKGYDILLIGIKDTRDPKGGFSRRLSEIAKGFDGPLAIADTAGAPLDRLFAHQSKMLIPVNGTSASRRAAEIGFMLARANHSQVTVLYVTRPPADPGNRDGRRRRGALRHDKAVLEEIVTLAERFEVDVRRSLRSGMAPEAAILKEVKAGYELIVLGADRRPGDTLYFGNTAAAVLEQSEVPKLFVAS